MTVRVEYKTVRKKLADGSYKEYYYDKLTGRPIDAKPGTPAFASALQRVRTERREINWAKGTLGSLLAQYQASKHWGELAFTTKVNYRAGLAALSGMEHIPLKDLRKAQLIRIRDGMRDRPGVANQTLGAISAMIEWAKMSDAEEWCDVEHNVVNSVARLEMGHWKAWPKAAIEKFEEADNITRQARLGFGLLNYTAQRRGDVLKMQWSDYNPLGLNGVGSIRLVQEKTGDQDNDDDELEIPVHPNLRALLDAEKANAKSTFIVHREDGRPYWAKDPRPKLTQAILFAEHFQAMQERVFGEGVHYCIHGLRKAAARRLAEAGCSIHEIMAITGHKTLAMVQLYTRGADQKRRSTAALKKLLSA